MGSTIRDQRHEWNTFHQVLGWTIDYGDIKEKFSPIFAALDHQPLYEIVDLPDNDPLSIARWIKESSSICLPELERIDLYQTRGCGVTIDWGSLGPALPI